MSKSSSLKKMAETKAQVIAEYFGLDKMSGKTDNVISDQELGSGDSTDVRECSPYLVKVTVADLNIRENPTVKLVSKGFTGKGTFTIVKEAMGEVI